MIDNIVPAGRVANEYTTSRRTNLFANSDGTGRPIGFVYRTAGDFWRAYTYVAGIGYGPFETEGGATAWVRLQWGTYLTETAVRARRS